MRPPICELCDAEFDPAVDGALVTFVGDDASRTWNERAERDRLVGHPPDSGWFCVDHVDLAREFSLTATFVEALSSMRTIVAPPVPPQVPDAGNGRFVRSERFDQTWFEWDLPLIDAARMADRLREWSHGLCTTIGLEPPSDYERRTVRNWSPMDGVGPPNCPYDDTTTDEAAALDHEGRPVRVVVEHQVVHWSDEVVNSATADLTVGGAWPGERGHPPLVGLSTFGRSSGGRDVAFLRLRGRRREHVLDAVDRLVGRLGDT